VETTATVSSKNSGKSAMYVCANIYSKLSVVLILLLQITLPTTRLLQKFLRFSQLRYGFCG